MNFFLSLKLKSILSLTFLLILSYMLFNLNSLDKNPQKCLYNEFKLKGMHSCHTFLTCEDFQEVKIGKLIGVGAIKAVYHAKWKGLDVALSILNNPLYEDDFSDGMRNIRKFQEGDFSIQGVGFCEDELMFLTEFHKNGDATNIFQALKNYPHDRESIIIRLNLCYRYVQILACLHNFQNLDGSYSSHVLCDSNDLNKLLSQFLVTDDMSIILNDMDAIPPVVGNGVKCGNREIKGDFVAPEQLWKLPGNFNYEKMPAYDEKTDIWKVPAVCDYFLGNTPEGFRMRQLVAPIHEECKNVVPMQRPTAKELEAYYLEVKRKVEYEIINA